MQLKSEEPHNRQGTHFDAAVRSQLERILGSELFRRSGRLSAFLRFVTEEALSSRGDVLKEHVLGSELYGKGPEFDGSADPIVRVDARRLRDKLREYYAEFPRDPIIITLPKGTYQPAFADNLAAQSPSALKLVSPVEPRRQNRRLLWRTAGVVAGLAVVLAVAAWALIHRPGPAPVHILKLTTFPGQKGAPALSPDGNFVAFASSGPDSTGSTDIWVEAVKGGALRRLTETPQFRETAPAWSPDGTEIAFVRNGQGVFILPQSGGPERKVSDTGNLVGWMPDAKSLLIRDNGGDGPYCIYQVFLNTLARRRLTEPPVGVGDGRFSISPDGTNLAFIRFEHPGVADIYVLPMEGGQPRRLTNWNDGEFAGITWMPNGRELLYSTKGRLWRIPANLAQPGRGSPIESIAGSAENPAISRSRPEQPARLVFQASNALATFRIVDLAAPLYNDVFQAVKPFVAPSDFIGAGAFSPDGSKFMFASGPPPLRLWTSAVDGTAHQQVTSIQASQLSPGSWSPDGQRIVYDAAIDGNNDIFVVDTGGGRPRRLTFEPALDGVASWSRNGQWIYFTSTRAGAIPDIWRVPAAGGEAVRITRHGGIRPQESPDGKYLYYADRPRDGVAGASKLMQVPVGGGPETALLSGLTTFWWSVADAGIFFVTREPAFDAIDRYNFNDHQVVRLGRLAQRAAPISSQLNVSRDGRWALVAQRQIQTDLMLVEDFK
jgi:Tol biopolymer transport system component